jgi:hypothetical protein
MTKEYSVDVCNQLKMAFQRFRLHRPMNISRYDAGDELEFDIVGVERGTPGHIRLVVEFFAGGGFAGQVYRVRVIGLDTPEGHIGSLKPGGSYALKILIPPTGFARFFRNALYRIGFQGFFQQQVNPHAVRSGALWQKFFRRGALMRFGIESEVNDIHATLIDMNLGSCGEISDWVDGRSWRLEVDEYLDVLKRYHRGLPVDPKKLGSPEYRTKKRFMADFVRLLHDMGGNEFARQYEWWTGKSQPNCLKRFSTPYIATKGLVAVDFRAGLVLLPFLPMSPVDVKLIFSGLWRGRLVQFDRGNIKKLMDFIKKHPDAFIDCEFMLSELKRSEEIYRNSVPDITCHHVRLLFSRKLWSTILSSSITGWGIRKLIDADYERKLRRSRLRTAGFYLLGLVPFFGNLIRKWLGNENWRKHYRAFIFKRDYMKRAIRGKCVEKCIGWHRRGRINEFRAIRISESLVMCTLHLVLSLLPSGLHRFLSDGKFRRERLVYLFVRPVRLYFNSGIREQWLRDMIAEGEKKQMLGDHDVKVIHSQLGESYIQKYLKSLAVHVLTLPVTQIVSVLVSWIYVRTHPGLSGPEAMAAVAAILVLFQITPVSPGSLVRGFYVLFLVIKERNFRDYNIAIFLSFFKYIGYLAFPIQMTTRYPELARFMAGHWATEAVHHIPVFGERGALLEHWVFNLFYNWPLTIRRRMRKIAEIRLGQKPRYWHVGFIAVIGAGLFGLAERLLAVLTGIPPVFKDLWWFMFLLPFTTGVLLARTGKGARLSKRIVSAVLCGILMAWLHTVISLFLTQTIVLSQGEWITAGTWRLFIYTIFSAAGTLYSELKCPDPDLKSPVSQKSGLS